MSCHFAHCDTLFTVKFPHYYFYTGLCYTLIRVSFPIHLHTPTVTGKFSLIPLKPKPKF